MSNIVFSDGDDNAYCDSCDALLYERRDQSLICSNPQCARVYDPNRGVQKHKMDLQPEKSPYNNDGPELVSITGYTAADGKKKQPTPGDIEDRMFVKRKSGMSITSYEEWLPEG